MPDASIVIDALADCSRDGSEAARPGVFRIVVERLHDRYGRRLVDATLRQYERALLQQQRALRQENRALERQVARARTKE
jgi:hypothetical protein